MNRGINMTSHRIGNVFCAVIFVLFTTRIVAQSLSYSDLVTVPQVDSTMNNGKTHCSNIQTPTQTEKTSSGINWSTESYDKRKQILPDQYPGKGRRGDDEYDPTVKQDWYRGKDGTKLYVDDDGNMYDSNGVRYGVRTKNGTIRELNWWEQQYDKRFNVNYAERAFEKKSREEEEERKAYEKAMKGQIPESDFAKGGVKEFDIKSGRGAIIGNKSDVPMPEKDNVDWTVEPMYPSVDTSKLESLLKARIRMLEQFIMRVESNDRIDKQDTSRYDDITAETLKEANHIDEQIKCFNVSDDERNRMAKQTIANVESLGDKVKELEEKLTELTKKSDGQSCSCKDPSPNVTVAGRTGWASCDKCNKLIGAVTVDKNGEVHVASRNQVANEMVKDMVKEMLAKDKK